MKFPITPDYLQSAPEKLVSIYDDLEQEILQAICEQFKTGNANETALERIRILQRRGYPLRKIEAAIKKATGLSNKELSKVYGGAIERNRAYFNGVLDKLRLVFSKTRREALQAEIDAIERQTNGTFDNITQSFGFVYHDTDGKLVASTMQQAYEKVLNDAVMQVQSGAFDYNTAIRNAVKRLADSGIQTIDYESGYHCRADVAVRRAVMTGITQISAKYTDALMEEVGTDLLEVTAHPGARDKDGPKGWENHKAWQGKVYSKKRGDIYPCVYDVCGLGDVAGLCGANCRHHYHAFVDGISERAYTDEELANIDKPPFEFEGNKYTAYEATQKQRQLEAALRSIKRRMLDYKAAGLDDYYNAAAIKYRRLTDEYKKFSKAAGLPTQEERAFVPEFTGKDHRTAVKQTDAAYKQALKDVNAQSTSLNTVDKYIDSTYNSSQQKTEQELLSRYKSYVDSGWVSPLVGFDGYKNLYNRVNAEIVGLTTSNGIKLAFQTEHFLQRVIGTMKDPEKGDVRSGVDIKDIIDALLNGEVLEIKIDDHGRPSQRFRNGKCMVSVNPETGALVQCNPYKKKK